MKSYTFDEIKEFVRRIENKKLVETKEILLLQDKNGDSVAHWLSIRHSTWITDDLEILSLANRGGRTVEDILIRAGKI